MSKILNQINTDQLAQFSNIIMPKVGSRVKVSYVTIANTTKIREGYVIGIQRSGITTTVRVLYPHQDPALRLVELLQIYSPKVKIEMLATTNRKIRAKLNYLIEKTPKNIKQALSVRLK